MRSGPRRHPDAVLKRSAAGEASARSRQSRIGDEDWDGLSPAQQDARLKAATQSLDQKVKGGKDDVADFTDWQRQAAVFGWQAPRSFMACGPWLPELSTAAASSPRL